MLDILQCAHGNDTPMVSYMMTEIIPHCLEIMLLSLLKENRTEFISRIVAVWVKKDTAGMSGKRWLKISTSSDIMPAIVYQAYSK